MDLFRQIFNKNPRCEISRKSCRWEWFWQRQKWRG